MGKKRLMIIVIAAAGFYFSGFTAAETVVLKSGKIIEGKILENTDDYIKIDYFGVPLTYYLDDVESIKEDEQGSLPAGAGSSIDAKSIQPPSYRPSYTSSQGDFMSEMEREYIRVIESDYELSPEEKQKAIEYLKNTLYSQQASGRNIAY